MPTEEKVIARWESKSGKHWVELYSNHTYAATGAGGALGEHATDTDAIAAMQYRVDRGHFLPDAAKTPMKRTV